MGDPMKIEITEEMREALRRWREQRAAGGIAYGSANALARLVSAAVEREEGQ